MAIIMQNCTTCGGSGLVMADAGGGLVRNENCPTCHGRKVLRVHVPDPKPDPDEDK